MKWIWTFAAIALTVGLGLCLVYPKRPADGHAGKVAGADPVVAEAPPEPQPVQAPAPAAGAAEESEAHVEPVQPLAPRPEAVPVGPVNVRDAAVQLEWSGASTAPVGQPADYTLLVRNASSAPVEKVAVNVRLGNGVALVSSTPPGAAEGEALAWPFDVLLPGQVKSIQLRLAVNAKGDVTPRAWATYSCSSAAALTIHADEAKVAVKAAAPDKCIVGDTATFVLTVSNPGDGVAHDVRLHAQLSDGLEHVRGRSIDFDLGDLRPGEPRSVKLVCTAKAGGSQKCHAAAEARDGLKAEDEAAVAVLAPSLDVELSGPGVKYVGRKAAYAVRVINKGDVAAGNVSVIEAVPPGFKFVSASDGGRYDGAATVSWFLGELAPGQARDLRWELVAVRAGDYQHRVTACTERNARLEVSRDLATRVEDLSALTLEVADTDDPVEVGRDTWYEIVVNNTGSRTESDVRVRCTLPEQLELKDAHGETRYHVEGNVLTFEPVPRMARGQELVYKVRARALTAGTAHFRAELTGSGLTEPVVKTEATRVYADRP